MKRVINFISIFAGLLLVYCSQKNDTRQASINEPIPDSVYVKQANKLVALTFDTLRNSLLKAISERGLEEAIAYCKENANDLTSAYADSVVITRTALRPRNPSNQPDSMEVTILREMANALQSGKIPDVKLVRSDTRGEVHVFKPILLQPMCLNCHGAPLKEVQNSTLSRIKTLYPNDQALNFKTGDLRGSWHVVFIKKQ